MNNTKTEAQRLADELDSRNPWDKPLDRGTVNSAAAELRHLDAENQQLRAQLAKAVAEEREACAKVCDDRYGELFEPEAQELAAAIRARSNT